MLLMDLGNSLETPLEEARVLLDNLCQFCSIFVNRSNNRQKTAEELIGPAEMEWTKRLLEIFNNLYKARNTQDMPPLLKQVMSKFNNQHEFKVNVHIRTIGFTFNDLFTVLSWKSQS